MKCMTIIFAIAASALLLASCNRPAGIPAELRAIMDANRAIALPPPLHDFAERAGALLTPNLDPEMDARVAAVVRQHTNPDITLFNPRASAMPTTPPQGPHLSHEDLVKDIHFLFDLLRHAYVGYQYFGGDDVFLPLRDSMLERLGRMSDPLHPQVYLNQVLVPELQRAIRDNHFRIHNAVIGPPTYFPYMNADIILRETANGFVAELDGATYRLVETTLPDGTPVDAILPTLTADGELAWAFGRIVSGEGQTTTIRALFENAETGEARSRLVSLRWVSSTAQASQALLETREENGVAIVANRSLSADWPDMRSFYDTLDEFYRSGYESRSIPALVLDLRSHRGGMANLAFEWARGFAGRAPICELALMPFVLGSSTMVDQIESFGGLLDRSPIPQSRWETHFLERINDPDQRLRWLLPDLSPPRSYIPNDNLVIVLMDQRVGSAGERFISYLRQLENALFVGTNTRGVLLTGNVAQTTLPYSGFGIMFGLTLNLRPDLSQFEGRGFMPDLWVPPDESLERVLAFIERYGLNR